MVAPCYNGGHFLPGLMASLGRQTFRDFDVVIVDDGSDDEETLRELAAMEGRARVIRQDNRGPSAARNTGIAHARADIVAILDCDDTIEPAYLAETVPVLLAAPPNVAMAFTHMRTAGGQASVGRRYFNRFDLLFTNTVSVGLVLRKGCWRAVGGYDETHARRLRRLGFHLALGGGRLSRHRSAKPLYIYYITAGRHGPSRSSGVRPEAFHAQLWRRSATSMPNATAIGDSAPMVANRDGTGHIPLWKGLAAYVLAQVMPDAWFSQLVTVLRNRSHHGRKAAPIRPAVL